MAREPGTGWRRGWGYVGGWLGGSGAACPGAGSPAQLPAQPFAWGGGLHLPGGVFPIIVAGASCAWPSWELGADGRMCPVDLCWKLLALPLALPLTPGLRICRARVNTVPWGRGAAGCPGWWAAGTPGSKGDWQPCPPSASEAISPAEPAVAPAHGPIRIRVKGRVCS